MKKGTLFLIAITASLMPIWRDMSWEGNVNTWEALYYTLTRSKEHIPHEQAIAEAQQHWSDYSGVPIAAGPDSGLA